MSRWSHRQPGKQRQQLLTLRQGCREHQDSLERRGHVHMQGLLFMLLFMLSHTDWLRLELLSCA
jgi:hypothetical protein